MPCDPPEQGPDASVAMPGVVRLLPEKRAVSRGRFAPTSAGKRAIPGCHGTGLLPRPARKRLLANNGRVLRHEQGPRRPPKCRPRLSGKQERDKTGSAPLGGGSSCRSWRSSQFGHVGKKSAWWLRRYAFRQRRHSRYGIMHAARRHMGVTQPGHGRTQRPQERRKFCRAPGVRKHGVHLPAWRSGNARPVVHRYGQGLTACAAGDGQRAICRHVMRTEKHYSTRFSSNWHPAQRSNSWLKKIPAAARRHWLAAS